MLSARGLALDWAAVFYKTCPARVSFANRASLGREIEALLGSLASEKSQGGFFHGSLNTIGRKGVRNRFRKISFSVPDTFSWLFLAERYQSFVLVLSDFEF